MTSSSGITAGALLGQWTRLLLGTLTASGVTDYVVSPGSRNAPLLFAALDQPGATCHSVVDERSAGFFALGLARATGRTVALICTSGSAGGHYLPALIEAKEAGVGLIVITADRPSHLQGCGAPQTIDQTDLFGKFASSAPPLGEPDPRPEKLRALVRSVRQSVLSARGPVPGPVHLNVPFDKPLEPTKPTSSEETALAASCADLLRDAAPPLPVPLLSQSDRVIDDIARYVTSEEATWMVLGPVPNAEAVLARQIAARLGLPCLSDLPQAGSGGQVPFVAGGFGAEAGLAPPERILHVGPPAVAASWARYLETYSGQLVALPGPHYKEPAGVAGRIILGDVEELLRRLVARASEPASHKGSLHSFEQWTDRLGARVKSALTDADLPPNAEAVATYEVLRQARHFQHILVGNSLPLRLSSWVAPALPGIDAAFHTARGANGIDGWISAAAGVAAGTNQATLALLGDVTAAHDVGALVLASGVDVPLVLVVLDNGGGRIFDHLPVRAAASDRVRAFLRTPLKLDWEALSRGFGVRFARPERPEGIGAILAEAAVCPGATLVHIQVDSDSTFTFLEKVRSGLGAPL